MGSDGLYAASSLAVDSPKLQCIRSLPVAAQKPILKFITAGVT